MSTTQGLIVPIKTFVKSNSTLILVGVGVGGTISTALLSVRSGKEATLHLADRGMLDAPLREKTVEVWKYYIPPAVVGGITVAAIVSANSISSKRAAGLAAAYSVSEKTLAEYREKVIEKVGEKQERGIKDSVRQSLVDKNPQKEVVSLGDSGVLTLEMFTGRYFSSDMESLRKAQNDVNEKLLREAQVTLSEFYWMVGLQSTSYSDYVGWVSDELLDLDFSTTISSTGVPCITFDYNYIRTL